MVVFWRNNYEPAALLATRTYLSNGLDSTVFAIYRLTDGIPDAHFWWWPSFNNPDPSFGGYRRDYRLATAVPLPPPPETSVQLIGLISYAWNGRDMGYDYYLSNTTSCMWLVLHMLGPDDTTLSISNYAGYASWTQEGGNGYLGISGSFTRTVTRQEGSYTTYGARLRNFRIESDSLLQTSVYIQGCDGNNQSECNTYPTCTVYDSEHSEAITVSRISDITGAVISGADSVLAWSSPTLYSVVIAADVVPGNLGRNFLRTVPTCTRSMC